MKIPFFASITQMCLKTEQDVTIQNLNAGTLFLFDNVLHTVSAIWF